MKVSDLHQQRVFTAEAEETLGEAARAMLELGVRHVPIVDHGRLLAVLSIRDLLAAETSATAEGDRG
jgi:CBS domain-containing protein